MDAGPDDPWGDGPGRWWPRHAGVRVRTAAAAMVVVAIGVAMGALLFVLQLQRALMDGVDTAAVARASDIAVQLAQGVDPNVAAVSTAGEAALVQVLGSRGEVVAASSNVVGEPAITDLRPTAGQVLRTDSRTPVGEDTFRVVALGVGSRGVDYIVVVGQSMAGVADSIQAVVGLLVIGVPALVVVVGGATVVFVGRGLRPVEAIRVRVAGLQAGDLDARVPVPGGRDEVARLAGTMNAMLDRLAAAQHTQRRFIADAGHELRSPIATLKAGVEVAAADRTRANLEAVFATVNAETDRLERLVTDLLLLAQVDERGLRVSVGEVDLDDLAGAEVRRLRASTDLTVQVRLVPVRVVGDRHRLSQALRNVVDNAACYATSVVSIRLARDGDRAVVEVSDDGPGVPVVDRQRVFGRFVRIDEGRARSQGGSGLGLAIVAEVVAAHGGTVGFVDSVGQGATVRLEIPAVVAHDWAVGTHQVV